VTFYINNMKSDTNYVSIYALGLRASIENSNDGATFAAPVMDDPRIIYQPRDFPLFTMSQAFNTESLCPNKAAAELLAEGFFILVHDAKHFEQFIWANWYCREIFAKNPGNLCPWTDPNAVNLMPIARPNEFNNVKENLKYQARINSILGTFSDAMQLRIKNNPDAVQRARLHFLKTACGFMAEENPQPNSFPNDLRPTAVRNSHFSVVEVASKFYSQFGAKRQQLATSSDFLAYDPPVSYRQFGNVPRFEDLSLDSIGKWTYVVHGVKAEWKKIPFDNWPLLYNYEMGFLQYMYYSAEENNGFSTERAFEQSIYKLLNPSKDLTTPWEIRRLKFLRYSELYCH